MQASPEALSFNAQLDQHGAWRRNFALRLKLLAQWMKDHDLLESAVEDRLHKLEYQVRNDKIMVAFVAEFSRGKSEMVNAVFFAGYGRRIMPASAGRTTMCPTEMGYDPDVPPCLRLLPIETRLQSQSLMEWRMVPEKWTRVDLDVQNPQQLAAAFEMVAQTLRVTQDEARALGFWNEDSSTAIVDADGKVEVPKWRHALINIAHPLLKQGLVILDTPGLNAIGAEPELTVSLIPQAQAVVFILGADTGVTKSDLEIWREHLVSEPGGADGRYVVLNKIDTLWDELSTAEQVEAQIQRQRASTADILGLPHDKVIAVSAQKGLVAKVNNDAALLQRSGLAALESALGNRMLLDHQQVLRRATHRGIEELRAEAGRVIHMRKRDLTEQVQELQGLHGKNSTVIKHMRSRISNEQTEFDLSGAKIHAVRSVHVKLLKEVFDALGSRALKAEMEQLSAALMQKGIKLGVKKSYAQTFGRLRESLTGVQSMCSDIQTMLSASFRQLNAEYGFSLQPIAPPNLSECLEELEAVERNHVQFLGLGNVFRLTQPEFTERLLRALYTRLRSIYHQALSDIEHWSKSVGAQLDTQLRERRRNFTRRIDAIDRIQQAAGSLEDRIGELAAQEQAVDALQAKLAELTAPLLMGGEPEEGATVDLALA